MADSGIVVTGRAVAGSCRICCPLHLRRELEGAAHRLAGPTHALRSLDVMP